MCRSGERLPYETGIVPGYAGESARARFPLVFPENSSEFCWETQTAFEALGFTPKISVDAGPKGAEGLSDSDAALDD